MTPIAARPAEVVTRTVPGHWEGDLIKGARNGSAVGTLVERTTRLVILAEWTGRMPRVPARALQETPAGPPAAENPDVRSRERDGRARAVGQRLAIQIFFADPYSPWQRGTNENTNGLLRQYLPKGTDLSGIRNVS